MVVIAKIAILILTVSSGRRVIKVGSDINCHEFSQASKFFITSDRHLIFLNFILTLINPYRLV